MGLLPAIVAELKADASKFTATMDKASTQFDKLGKDGQSSFAKLKATAGPALLGVGAAITGVGAALEHLSGPLESAHASLKTSIENMGQSFDAFKEKIDSTDKRMENFGHTNADTEQALSKLTVALGDPTQALDRMQLVADIAAQKHISLSEAATLVAKVHGGAAKPLKEFGIVVDAAAGSTSSLATNQEKATLKSAEFDKALDTLGDKLKNQAAAHSETFSGKLEVLRTKITDVAAHLGEKLAPALVSLGPLMMGVGTIAQSNAIPALLGMASSMGPLIVAAGLVAGGLALMRLNTHSLTIDLEKLKTDGAEAAAAAIRKFQADVEGFYNALNKQHGLAADSAAAEAAATKASAVTWSEYQKTFQKVLDKQPAMAQAMIDGARIQGYSADQIDKLNSMVEDNVAKTADASIAQDDYTAKVQAGVAAKEAAAQAAKDQAAADKTAVDDMIKDAEQLETAYHKSLTSVKAEYSEMATSILIAKNATTEQLDQLAKDAAATDSAVSSGFKSMTDVVSAFDGQTRVTGPQVDKWFKDQQKAAATWSADLTALSKAGLNDGLLQQLAAAGPKAEPLIKGLLDDIKKNGVDSINSATSSIDQIMKITANSLKDAEVLNQYFESGKAAAKASAAGWAAGISGTNSAGQYAVGFDYSGALSGGLKGVKAYADGGWVDAPAGTAVPAIVHGGEFVLSREMIANMTAGGGSSAPVVVNLNVNVPVGADKTAAGGEIVAALQAWGRTTGRNWMFGT